VSPKILTANASAAFASSVSMVPRLWARLRRSLLVISFCFGDFIPLEIAVRVFRCPVAFQVNY